jgi:bile acid:Na+ symporter, BASS family
LTPAKIVSIVMLVSLMLDVGLRCNLKHLVEVLKDYGLLSRALLANFILVPIIGVLVVRAFQLNMDGATGLLLMAIAPGVPFVVIAGGRKKGGSLSFAIELAFLMPALSVLTVPITAQLVLPGGELSHLSLAHELLALVLFQLAPLLAGMIVVQRWPQLAEKLLRPVALLALLAVIALLAVLAPTIVKAVASVFGSRAILADASVVVLSLITGWLLGGPGIPFRHTLSIATGLRNIGLCAVVASSQFEGTLVGPAVLTYLLVQFVVCGIVGAYFARSAKPVTA